MTKKLPPQLSGKKFVELVRKEIAARNTKIARVTLSAISKASGLSDAYLRTLMAQDEPNPSAATMRAVLHTLGYEVENLEDDVIPMLERKGVIDPSIVRQSTGLGGKSQ